MESLKITINLRTPMVMPKQALHLDALLGALVVSQVMAEQGEGINPAEHHYNLPVERFEHNGEWVFKASQLRLHQESSELWMQTGRIDLAEAAQHREEGWLNMRANRPNTAGGPFKTSLNWLNIANGYLTGYCVGNKAELEQLLAGCRQVGGNRCAGWGRVMEVLVESVPESECDWQDRVMPQGTPGLDESHALGVSCLNSPYWERNRMQKALVPL